MTDIHALAAVIAVAMSNPPLEPESAMRVYGEQAMRAAVAVDLHLAMPKAMLRHLGIEK